MTEFDDRFRVPDPNAVAQRPAVMVVRRKHTGRWHIAYVPKGVRFNDPSVYIFEEYSFREVEAARRALKDAYQDICRKAEARQAKIKAMDKKS